MKCVSKCILVAPKFDEPTSYSYLWSRRLKEEIEKKGWEVIDLSGRRISREEVEKALSENSDVPYIHYDHGSEEAHWGSETEAVVDTENVSLLSERITYCMNCLSAKRLGVEAWKRGCVYVGYVESFTFTVEDERLFCESANSGFIAYVNGETDWKRIKQVMVEAFNKAIDEAEDPFTKMWLRYDRDALRVYNAEAPESKCALRNLIIKILGPKLGWKISRKHALSIILLGAGTGVYVHDRIAEWAKLGYRLHGLDVGFTLVFISWLLISFEFVKWLSKK